MRAHIIITIIIITLFQRLHPHHRRRQEAAWRPPLTALRWLCWDGYAEEWCDIIQR